MWRMFHGEYVCENIGTYDNGCYYSQNAVYDSVNQQQALIILYQLGELDNGDGSYDCIEEVE